MRRYGLASVIAIIVAFFALGGCSGDGGGGGATGPGSQADIAPELVSPEDGAILNDFPRNTAFEWRPAAGADSYILEVEWFDPGSQDWNVLDRCETTDVTLTLGLSNVPSLIFDRTCGGGGFIGAQPGRWRVSSKDSSGALSAPSDWWHFEYTV